MRVTLKSNKGNNYSFYTDNVSGIYYWHYSVKHNFYIVGCVLDEVGLATIKPISHIEEVLDRMIKSLDRDYPTEQSYRNNLEEVGKRTHFKFHNSANIIVRTR